MVDIDIKRWYDFGIVNDWDSVFDLVVNCCHKEGKY